MKKIIIILACLQIFSIGVYANNLVVQLHFPEKSNKRVAAVMPIVKPQEISGTLVLDIVPYPADYVKGRYSVEYFLDDQLLYKTDGGSDNGAASFKYSLDTTKFANGAHKLIVNFWDTNGPAAIGINDVIITNGTNQ